MPIALAFIVMLYVRLQLGSTVFFGIDWYYTISDVTLWIENHRVELIACSIGSLTAMVNSVTHHRKYDEYLASVALVIAVLFFSTWFRKDIPLLNLFTVFSEKRLELSFVVGMISLGSVFFWLRKFYIAPVMSVLIIISIMTLYL
ncbi:hypothetical protein [Vibrio owensii]